MTATLAGFDRNAGARRRQPRAPPATVFFDIILPLIGPGVVSGALFAFVTSFDEVVVALFMTGPQQRTLPRQMFDGIRENISPTITAVATLLILLSILLLTVIELLRRRSLRLRGISPTSKLALVPLDPGSLRLGQWTSGRLPPGARSAREAQQDLPDEEQGGDLKREGEAHHPFQEAHAGFQVSGLRALSAASFARSSGVPAALRAS